jgi:alpha-1,3-rhamnosyl/mannosyltransferase
VKIFVDARMAHIGGTLTVATNLLAALLDLYGRRHEFTVLHAPGQAWKGPARGKLIHTRWKSTARWLIGDRLLLPGLVKRERPDLFHSFKRPQIRRVPGKKILTIHSSYPFLFPEFTSMTERLYWAPAMVAAAHAADIVTVVSETDRKNLCDTLGVDPRKVVAVPNAVDESFSPVSEPAELSAVRRRYGLPEHYVLFVGNAYRYKNLPNMIRAFDMAVSAAGLPHSFVWVGGKGNAMEEVSSAIASARNRSRFVRLGPLSADLAAIYSAADLFCFPTAYDSFGIPVLEAMACGTPVLVSPTGALLEVSGGAAFVVESTAPESIAEGIIRTLADTTLRAALRENGFARARRFSWSESARRTMELYERLSG